MSAPLPLRRFPRADLAVTALGFGTAPLGDLFAQLDEAVAIDTVLAGLERGIALIDTSPHYGNGLAELRVGAALRRYKGPRPVLSTKVGRVMEPFNSGARAAFFAGGLPHGARLDYSADGVKRSLEQSMLRLGVDRIDIALIHDVDVWTHGPEMAEQRIREALAGAYPALERMRAQGVIKSIGVGINEADVAARFARETDIDSVLLAGRYSLLEQPALDEFLPLALEKRIGVMLGGVFNSGILATGAVAGAQYNYKPAEADVLARVRAIETICAAHGVPLRIAALHFALAHPAVTSVVLGGVAPGEMADNVAAMMHPVPAALWADLKTAGLINAAAPTPQ